MPVIRTSFLVGSLTFSAAFIAMLGLSVSCGSPHPILVALGCGIGTGVVNGVCALLDAR